MNSNPDGVPLTCIYSQFDGYLDGHGAQLKEAFGATIVVNGMTSGVDRSTIANGMGCFAAQVIEHLKHEPGGVYVYPPEASDEEFTYTLYAESQGVDELPRGKIKVRVTYVGKTLFEGMLADLPGDAIADE